MIAWINGFLGLGAAALIGTRFLGLGFAQLLGAVVAVWLAGVLALVLVQEGMARPGLRRRFLGSSVRTWAFFLAVYFGTIFGLSPVLRDRAVFWPLFVPLVLVNGFSILVFGPYQDWRVAQAQRRARRQSLTVELPNNLS